MADSGAHGHSIGRKGMPTTVVHTPWPRFKIMRTTWPQHVLQLERLVRPIRKCHRMADERPATLCLALIGAPSQKAKTFVSLSWVPK